MAVFGPILIFLCKDARIYCSSSHLRFGCRWRIVPIPHLPFVVKLLVNCICIHPKRFVARTYSDGLLYSAFSFYDGSDIFSFASILVENFDGQLVVFPDQATLDFVNNFALGGDFQSEKWWVGYQRTAGVWRDVKGNIPSFLPWGAGFPTADLNANCAALNEATGKLENLVCSALLHGFLYTQSCTSGAPYILPRGCPGMNFFFVFS